MRPSILCLLVFPTLTTSAPGGAAPAATVSADGARYDLYTFDAPDDRTWSSARDFALARGGHLVNITSAEENALLVNAFTPVMSVLPQPFAWIGGTDETLEQTWIWRDGAEAGAAFWIGPPGAGSIPGVYANWHPSEPNNFGPDNYAAVLLGAFASLQIGQWIDSPDNPPLGSDPIGGFIVESPICSADLAPPFGLLDLADINAFVLAFLSQDPAADLATPLGIWDLDDVAQFVASFLAGCP
jgi:hypothetical protein